MTFDDFWEIARSWRGRCPNPKGPARKAFERAVRNGAEPREIIAGAKGYLQAMEDIDTDPQFICQAATFLNQERWEQYLNEPAARRFLEQPKLEVVK